MATHSKMNVRGAFNIASRVIIRQSRSCNHQKDDFFGTGEHITKQEIIDHAAILLSMGNQWHDGAVCSHLLALVGSKFYRQQIPLMRRLNLINLNLQDYTKVAKMIHELIRTCGVDECGVQLNESDRVGRQYLQDLAGRDYFKIDWKEDISERMSMPWVKLSHDGTNYTPAAFILKKHEVLDKLWRGMDAQNQ